MTELTSATPAQPPGTPAQQELLLLCPALSPRAASSSASTTRTASAPRIASATSKSAPVKSSLQNLLYCC